MVETFVFPADHPALHTEVGEKSGQTIQIRAGAGCGVFGPYVDLPAGPCVARMRFRGPALGRVLVDLAAESGVTALASRVVDLARFGGRPVELATVLDRPLTRCEARLYCLDDVQADLAAVEIEAGDYGAVDRSIRSEFEPATIVKGRDVNAGYVRGRWGTDPNLRKVVLADPDFAAALAATHGRSIVSEDKLVNLFLIVKYSDVRSGDIIEFGSYRGGSALFLACLAKRLRPGCRVFALDTFTGMPMSDPALDRHGPGGFADVDFPGLEKARADERLDNLILLPGLFQDTVGRIASETTRFFLTHIDCDIYDSAVFSIEYAKSAAVSGSYIVLDDPLTWDCLGAMQATEERLVQQGVFAEQTDPHLVYRYPPL